MELLAYHLRTKRVCGLNTDNTPKIENILVKLTGRTSLNKYSKSLNIRGFIKDSPPKIEVVLQRNEETGKWKQLGISAINEAQIIVDGIIGTGPVEKEIDYKVAFEEQKSKNQEQKSKNQELENRLKALENKDEHIVMESKEEPKTVLKTRRGPKGKTVKPKSDE